MYFICRTCAGVCVCGIKDILLNSLIQFRTLRKLCSLVRSNKSRKPMASLKNAVVKLRNLIILRRKTRLLGDCFRLGSHSSWKTCRSSFESKVACVSGKEISTLTTTFPVQRCPTTEGEFSDLCLLCHLGHLICTPLEMKKISNQKSMVKVTDQASHSAFLCMVRGG